MTPHSHRTHGLVILDFDGTVTDSEQEGAPFIEAYIDWLTQYLGASRDDIKHAFANGFARLAADPHNHGMMDNGRIVAPAMADPYLRTGVIARRVLQAFDTELTEELDRYLREELYPKLYIHSGIALREGAGEALQRLYDAFGDRLTIVTNSRTDGVQRKLATLPPQIRRDVERITIIGGARKYALGDLGIAPDNVPEARNFPGIRRPIYLRRAQYYATLRSLMERNGVGWNRVTVIGDIYELDLALPAHCGARIGLMQGPHTPDWEVTAVQTAGGAALLTIDDLATFALSG